MFDVEQMCEHSFRNFHAKGLDYLCLSRTPELTRKVYFFEGDLSSLPEIVVPHNHRYPFVTTVLSGCVRNKVYHKPDVINTFVERHGKLYDEFDYITPLNGGDGFKWAKETVLVMCSDVRYQRGHFYRSLSASIHTLDIRTEDSVILLEQMHDDVSFDKPAQAFRLAGSREPPSLDGLYDRMTPDHAVKRFNQFLDLIGNRK